MRKSRTVLGIAALVLSSCGTGSIAIEQGEQAIAAAAISPSGRFAGSVDSGPSTVSSNLTPLMVKAPPERLRAAVTDGPLPVYVHPEAYLPFRTLDATTILGTPTVVSILESNRERLKVMLPGRPNGATGWVEWDDVDVFEVARSVIVDLEDRTLHVMEGDDVVFEAPVGIGTTTSPTPTGDFFVTDAAVLANESGPWGPYAFGLSARSNTVTEFNGGDGIIGIHGTNRPGSIGLAQSLGCIRLENGTMTDLFELLSVGTPVSIRR